MDYTKREKQILRSVSGIEIKYSIRSNKEYTISNYRELADNLKKKGIKLLTDNEIKRLSKIGGMTLITHQINRSLKGYI